MPSRNIVREFEQGGYYHVYNRGVEKRIIFLDNDDYNVFLGLLKKYLSGDKKAANTNNRHKFPSLQDEVNLLAYCLMPNHVHLLLHELTGRGIERLMRRVMTGYVMYFNNRYRRVGSLFQGPYKASRITSDAYLYHISRYIHLNPEGYQVWPYSSYKYYANANAPQWLNVKIILELFDNTDAYRTFVSDYVNNHEELQLLRWQLANDISREEM